MGITTSVFVAIGTLVAVGFGVLVGATSVFVTTWVGVTITGSSF